jgi:hypothetical protein
VRLPSLCVQHEDHWYTTEEVSVAIQNGCGDSCSFRLPLTHFFFPLQCSCALKWDSFLLSATIVSWLDCSLHLLSQLKACSPCSLVAADALRKAPVDLRICRRVLARRVQEGQEGGLMSPLGWPAALLPLARVVFCDESCPYMYRYRNMDFLPFGLLLFCESCRRCLFQKFEHFSTTTTMQKETIHVHVEWYAAKTKLNDHPKLHKAKQQDYAYSKTRTSGAHRNKTAKRRGKRCLVCTVRTKPAAAGSRRLRWRPAAFFAALCRQRQTIAHLTSRWRQPRCPQPRRVPTEIRTKQSRRQRSRLRRSR